MKRSSSTLWFFAALAAAAAFVLHSGSSLPPVVASHFRLGGEADGFMPREGYLALMVALTIGLPLLLYLISASVRRLPVRFINLPHREYWLAPERREETLAFIHGHGAYMALLAAAFLCFVHWLVVLANRRQPPLFPEEWLQRGGLLFAVALAGGIGVLLWRFGRRP